jgi:hypothetical protein
VAYVRDGLDAADQTVLATHFSHEQEVTVPGAVPFTWVVAYRKFERRPSLGAPPEFTGPIMVRDHLAALEPAAYQKIVQALSIRSKYTQAFEAGQPWRDKLAEGERFTYQFDFKAAHPNPGPAVLWARHP